MIRSEILGPWPVSEAWRAVSETPSSHPKLETFCHTSTSLLSVPYIWPLITCLYQPTVQSSKVFRSAPLPFLDSLLISLQLSNNFKSKSLPRVKRSRYILPVSSVLHWKFHHPCSQLIILLLDSSRSLFHSLPCDLIPHLSALNSSSKSVLLPPAGYHRLFDIYIVVLPTELWSSYSTTHLHSFPVAHARSFQPQPRGSYLLPSAT